MIGSGWLDPITDRTKADADRGNPKGRYNAADMNRVEQDCVYLADLFARYGYAVTLQSKVWTAMDLPTRADTERYLGNLRALQNAYYSIPGMPMLPKSLEKLGFSEANALETVLAVLHTAVFQMFAAFRRLGAPGYWLGSNPLPTAQSDRGRLWAELDAMKTTWAQWGRATWYLLRYGEMK